MPRGRILALLAIATSLAASVAACTTGGSTHPSALSGGPATPALTTASATGSQPAPTRSNHPRRRTHLPSRPGRPVETRTRPAGPSSSTHPSPPPTRTPTHRTPSRQPGTSLPLDDPTGDATQVLTVVAGAESDTSGMLQAWRRVGGGWRRVGPALPAWLGTAGMTPQPRETLSATPMGSFTLTRAFGSEPDPGTRIRYTQTTPDDWWISQPGPLYNTFQSCASGCGFAQGSPNEHLYYVAPEYEYAVVIDYNTSNAGPVRQGAGSAFFLHVSAGAPTAGCVAIDRSALVRIMRWLDPADHPRILIGIP